MTTSRFRLLPPAQPRDSKRPASGSPKVLGLLFPVFLALGGPVPAARINDAVPGLNPARAPAGRPGKGTIPVPRPPPKVRIPILAGPEPFTEDPDDAIELELKAPEIERKRVLGE